MPSSQRLERLSLLGRQLLHAAVSVELWYGASALRNLKVVVAVDSEQVCLKGEGGGGMAWGCRRECGEKGGNMGMRGKA